MSSMFLEKRFPQWQIQQKGSSEFNMTLLGNDFDANNPMPLSIVMDSGGKKGHTELIANSRSNFSDLDCGQAEEPLPDQVTDPSFWLVHEALDAFRRLGSVDLQLNHPAVWSLAAAQAVYE